MSDTTEPKKYGWVRVRPKLSDEGFKYSSFFDPHEGPHIEYLTPNGTTVLIDQFNDSPTRNPYEDRCEATCVGEVTTWVANYAPRENRYLFKKKLDMCIPPFHHIPKASDPLILMIKERHHRGEPVVFITDEDLTKMGIPIPKPVNPLWPEHCVGTDLSGSMPKGTMSHVFNTLELDPDKLKESFKAFAALVEKQPSPFLVDTQRDFLSPKGMLTVTDGDDGSKKPRRAPYKPPSKKTRFVKSVSPKGSAHK